MVLLSQRISRKGSTNNREGINQLRDWPDGGPEGLVGRVAIRERERHALNAQKASP
jgi:hypothetical protein